MENTEAHFDNKVIPIHQARLFTVDEARGLFPVVKRITEAAHKDVQILTARLSYIKEESVKKEIEDKIQKRFQQWSDKIQKLGCVAKSIWLVDFDSGEGYYCWQYPEEELTHFHGYFDGFQGRVKINEQTFFHA